MNSAKALKTLAVIMSLTGFLLVSGCSGDQSPNNSALSSDQQSSSAVSSSDSDTMQTKDSKSTNTVAINVYFPDANGDKLIATKKQLPTNATDKYTAAVQLLVDGPISDKEGIAIIPKNTKLLSVKVNNGVATVDFSKEFKSNFAGGSTNEIMLIGSIVDTLTQFDDVKSVQFTIEGKKLDALSGHLDLTVPQTRMNDILK